MHLGKFHAVINALNVEYSEDGISGKINSVIQQLDSLANNPGNVSVADSFKQHFENLRQQLAASTFNKPYPTLAALLGSINAEKYVGDKLFLRIEALIVENGMTPQLAATALRNLFADVTEFYQQIDTIDTGFTKLKVEFQELKAGEGEIGISIPEPEGDRLLVTLAKTAKEWDIALRPFVELADPEHNAIVVRTISSSDWQFYLAAAPGVYLALSTAVSRLNELLQKLVVTRNLISQLTGSGLSPAVIAAAATEADGFLDAETRSLAEKIVDEHAPADTGRANELKTAVTTSLKFIARQMAKSVTIEVRYVPPEMPKSSDQNDSETKDQAAKRIGELTEVAAQIARNMELVKLDATAKEILNLTGPEEDMEETNV